MGECLDTPFQTTSASYALSTHEQSLSSDSAPPLAMLALAAREMRVWLDGSHDRVVVLHCKGTVVFSM